jgi:hypothetical protein
MYCKIPLVGKKMPVQRRQRSGFAFITVHMYVYGVYFMGNIHQFITDETAWISIHSSRSRRYLLSLFVSSKPLASDLSPDLLHFLVTYKLGLFGFKNISEVVNDLYIILDCAAHSVNLVSTLNIHSYL